MPSLQFNLTDTFQPLIEFKKFNVRFFNVEIQNFDGPPLEFTFGDPAQGAQVAIRVPNKSTTSRENRALAGVLWGRTVTGTATVSIEIW